MPLEYLSASPPPTPVIGLYTTRFRDPVITPLPASRNPKVSIVRHSEIVFIRLAPFVWRVSTFMGMTDEWGQTNETRAAFHKLSILTFPMSGLDAAVFGLLLRRVMALLISLFCRAVYETLASQRIV